MSQAKKCKLCRCERKPSNGIDTTLGWFCYKCVKSFRQQTEALDDGISRQEILSAIDETA